MVVSAVSRVRAISRGYLHGMSCCHSALPATHVAQLIERRHLSGISHCWLLHVACTCGSTHRRASRTPVSLLLVHSMPLRCMPHVALASHAACVARCTHAAPARRTIALPRPTGVGIVRPSSTSTRQYSRERQRDGARHPSAEHLSREQLVAAVRALACALADAWRGGSRGAKRGGKTRRGRPWEPSRGGMELSGTIASLTAASAARACGQGYCRW